MNAAALTWLLASPVEGPEYPLGKLRFPSLTEPARPLRLTDLRYRVADAGSTLQSFEVRLKLGDFAFLGGEVRHERRGVFFDTQRLEIGLTEEEGRYTVQGTYRAPRLIFRARAERRPGTDGGSWVLDGQWALRWTSDLELLFGWLEDSARNSSTPLPTRPLRRVSVGVLYQRENHFELSGKAARSRVRTEGGLEFYRHRASAAWIWHRSRLELESTFAYEKTSGRLAREQGSASVAASVQIGSDLVARVSTSHRWEPGVKRFQGGFLGGLTFYGRRHRFARGSEAAPRTLDLARRAYRLGYNERRVYDLDGLRAFRERLSLSPRREELADALDDLYRAQVRERNVPQAGFEVARQKEDVLGVDSMIYRVFLAFPWRPAWPFRRSASSVEFLRVDYGLRERRFRPGLRAVSRQLLFTVALNREMSLRLRWEDPGPTPTEIAKLIERARVVELEYVYAFGR